MAKVQIVTQPVSVPDFFDKLYSGMIGDWQEKAKNLRVRRTRKMEKADSLQYIKT